MISLTTRSSPHPARLRYRFGGRPSPSRGGWEQVAPMARLSRPEIVAACAPLQIVKQPTLRRPDVRGAGRRLCPFSVPLGLGPRDMERRGGARADRPPLTG